MEIAVSSLNATEGTWFCPAMFDNRDKPEDERMAVRLLPLTGRELKQLRASAKVSLKPKKESDFLLLVEAREDAVAKELLAKKVAEVRNLTMRKDGVSTPVTNGEQLLELCLSGPPVLLDLVAEIMGALMDQSKLDEGALGN